MIGGGARSDIRPARIRPARIRPAGDRRGMVLQVDGHRDNQGPVAIAEAGLRGKRHTPLVGQELPMQRILMPADGIVNLPRVSCAKPRGGVHEHDRGTTGYR